MKKVSALALAVATATFTAGAQANDRLEETVVVSSRTEMPLRQVATSVSVVTFEDIQLRGFSNIADTLRYDTGIYVTNNGGVGKATSLRIRGEDSYRTKVYIDGIESRDPSGIGAGANFANLGSAGIQRIEILRGPQGMMYGADAGGVINISTISPEPGLSGAVSGEYGRFGTTDFRGYLAGGSETIDFSAIAATYETDGFNSLNDTPAGSRDEDGYENDTYHGRMGWNITDTFRAEAVIRHVESENEFDNCSTAVDFSPSDDCRNDYDEDAYRIALAHQGEQFSNTLAFNQFDTEREFFTEGVRTFATEGELQKIEYLGNWKAMEGVNLVYGADFINESIDSGSTDTDRDQEGYYLEYQGSFADSLFITAGARYDDNDDFGSETTYRASAAYLMGFMDGELKFKGSYGTGFRAPSLDEIAYNEGSFATPPAAGFQLSAETSEGYELGVGYYAANNWFVETVYFDQTIDDEIFFDLVNFSGYLQADESNSKGVEVIAEVPLGDMFIVSGNYTYNDTEEDSGEQRARVPEHAANFGLRFFPIERLVINLNYRISRDRADENISGVINEADDFEVLDISAIFNLTENLEFFGRVENVTDEDYEEIPNYNTSGAAGYAGVRYSF